METQQPNQTPNIPPMPTAGAATSQTGGAGAPIQVENVQYNVNVGKVKSKIGLASTLTSIFGWITVFVVAFGLVSLGEILFPGLGADPEGAKEFLVFGISVLVPVLPLFIFSVKRLNKALAENPLSIDDLYFKRSIRFNLVFGLIITCFWTIAFVYNILAMTLLQNKDVTGGAIFDSFFFFVTPAAFVYFFWTYQQKTKR